MANSSDEKTIRDTADGKVVVFCSQHNYMGEGAPTPGCSHCWKVYYIRYFAKVPANQRAEKIAELYAIVRRMIEEVKAGTFDYLPLPHPLIKIEKDSI